MNKTFKNNWILFLTIMAGLVIGSFIGTTFGDFKYFQWLNYGNEFGLTTPLILDLDIINLQFAFSFRFTIAGILGIILAVIIYKKF